MLLSVSHLDKSYDSSGRQSVVLRDVGFELDRREAVALVGESGSGKSTLLHLIAGLDRPSGGKIFVDGAEVSAMNDAQTAAFRRQTVGVIFQQFNLIPSLTARGNIAFHARIAGRYDPDWAAHLSERIGLSAQLDQYPETLSGGQQQRVAIARTLAARPKLVLADEPTGNLDEDTADRVIALLLESAAEVDAALLMVTHSPRLAAMMGRQLVLSHGAVQQHPVKEAREMQP